MPKVNIYSDDEVRQFLDGLPRHLTYSEMTTSCVRRFGQARAWSRAKIGRYWAVFHPPGKGKASRIDFDPEVREFVEDRLGRLTIRMILDECQERFGTERSPSKSSLHRYWQRSRKRKPSHRV